MRSLTKLDLNKVHFHPMSDKLANHLCAHTENDTPTFFRVIVAYHLAKIASQMRASIKLHNNNATLPINLYSIALAPSGAGKTKAMNFLEEDVCGLFNERFKSELLPYAADKNMTHLAALNGARKGTDPENELELLRAEFMGSGNWLSAFDAATPAALKQYRHKLLLAGAGSLNLEIDEIGDNITGNADALSKYLELYDKGFIKESLTKNTKENTRLSEIKGQTPCNLLMFGTSSSLLDGSRKEDDFYSILEKGYARRCFFAFGRQVNRNLDLSAEEIYDRNQSQTVHQFVDDLQTYLLNLADPINYKKEISLAKDEEILRIEYSMYCQDRANAMSEFDAVKRIEMEHRWFKALKLAATYAFIEGCSAVSETHFYNAIALVEESGRQFQELLSRDKPYVKLAKYLGGVNKQVTQVELVEDLPFYKGSTAQKNEMLTLATAYGYQNNIIIKKMYQDGIEFLKGEALKETNLDQLIVSYSGHVAYNYFNDSISWEHLEKLTQMKGMHWVAHHVLEGHRCEDKTKAGFNLLVIDVDGEVPLATAQALLKDYKAMYYTTKRHQTDGVDRFRIIFPMQYVLNLDSTDYKEFMSSVYAWLPFEVDEVTSQRSRKWLSHEGTLETKDGILFNPVEFIPKTSKNEQRKEQLMTQQSLSNLERWFVNNTGQGNRSNQLIKYALLLVDSGKTLQQVEQSVLTLNEKLPDKLSEQEIMSTIMVSARKHFAKQAAV